MKLLLDTNALIWWMEDQPMLGSGARDFLSNPSNIVVATIVSLWEITMKWRIGKYPLPGSAFAEFLERECVEMLGISAEHINAVEGLAMHHKDPFDHLILAQAKVEDAVIVTSDRVLTEYGIRCIPATR